ncbi:MAG: FadR/GntR family transcriptional regulator, partial [Spirochaetia bacterium]
MEFKAAPRKQTLAEYVSKEIKDSILRGELKPGENLPTEPELSQQFNVSRAVVRDAARMLLAQGLVDIQHGKGMYITSSQLPAFGEALKTALRREYATVWDVEEFEQMLLPEILALAARNADPEGIEKIRNRVRSYLKQFSDVMREAASDNRMITDAEREALGKGALSYMDAIFEATGNKLLMLIGPSLQLLHSMRSWGEDESDVIDAPEESINIESRSVNTFVKIIEMGDPELARKVGSEIFSSDQAMEEAMRRTPVLQHVHVSIPVEDFHKK